MVEDTQTAPRGVFAPGHEQLSGTHARTLDEKLRVVLPAGRWRALFADGARLGPWTGRLALWTARSWEYATGELLSLERMGLAPDRTYDDVVAQFHEVGLDAQGRLLLPESLRAAAGIGGKGAPVLLVGVGHHVEIWDAARRESDLAERDPDAGAKTFQAMKL